MRPVFSSLVLLAITSIASGNVDWEKRIPDFSVTDVPLDEAISQAVEAAGYTRDDIHVVYEPPRFEAVYAEACVGLSPQTQEVVTARVQDYYEFFARSMLREVKYNQLVTLKTQNLSLADTILFLTGSTGHQVRFAEDRILYRPATTVRIEPIDCPLDQETDTIVIEAIVKTGYATCFSPAMNAFILVQSSDPDESIASLPLLACMSAIEVLKTLDWPNTRIARALIDLRHSDTGSYDSDDAAFLSRLMNEKFAELNGDTDR